MATILLSSYYLTTSLKPKMAQEKLKEAIFDYIDQSDSADGFSLDLFVDDLANQEEPVFSLLDEEVFDDVDVEINDEGVDNIIQEYLEIGNDRSSADLEEDDEAEDDGEEEPEIFSNDDEED